MGEGQHIDDKQMMEETHEKQGMEGEGEGDVKLEMTQSRDSEKPKKQRNIVVCAMCNGKGKYFMYREFLMSSGFSSFWYDVYFTKLLALLFLIYKNITIKHFSLFIRSCY
jgi:hypothetical protein